MNATLTVNRDTKDFDSLTKDFNQLITKINPNFLVSQFKQIQTDKEYQIGININVYADTTFEGKNKIYPLIDEVINFVNNYFGTICKVKSQEYDSAPFNNDFGLLLTFTVSK